MSARFRFRFAGRCGLLAFAIVALGGCERTPSQTGSALTQPPVSSQPALQLHDRVCQPLVDETERMQLLDLTRHLSTFRAELIELQAAVSQREESDAST